MCTTNPSTGLLALLALPLIFAPLSFAAPAASCTFAPLATNLAVASGYAARRVASGVGDPRGIKFDSKGNLLVVDSGTGIKSYTVQDNGGDCVSLQGGGVIISDSQLNHGLELSPDSKTLFASTPENVYSYPYNPSSSTATVSSRRTLVNNMTNPDHVTRTLLYSAHVPNTLIVSRGSGDNIDPVCLDVTSGRAQVKAFNLNTATANGPLNYPSQGTLLAWGVRNEVGIAEHPGTGGVWGVENSGDQLVRNGVDIHEGDPGEELNSFGTLSSLVSGAKKAANYGYPTCFAAFDVSIMPNNTLIRPGVQFAINTVTAAQDAACVQDHQAPRNVFKPHQAPLDIKFNKAGTAAWVTFHGSWDRNVPDGYKVGYMQFDGSSGQPVPKSTSKNVIKNVFTNVDTQSCYSRSCVRPVSMAFDKKGRMFFSSDATGEIFIVTKADGSGIF